MEIFLKQFSLVSEVTNNGNQKFNIPTSIDISIKTHQFVCIRDHSYITSALVGGKGGSENANFLLFLVLKTCLRRGGAKNPKNVMT